MQNPSTFHYSLDPAEPPPRPCHPGMVQQFPEVNYFQLFLETSGFLSTFAPRSPWPRRKFRIVQREIEYFEVLQNVVILNHKFCISLSKGIFPTKKKPSRKNNIISYWRRGLLILSDPFRYSLSLCKM